MSLRGACERGAGAIMQSAYSLSNYLFKDKGRKLISDLFDRSIVDLEDAELDFFSERAWSLEGLDNFRKFLLGPIHKTRSIPTKIEYYFTSRLCPGEISRREALADAKGRFIKAFEEDCLPNDFDNMTPFLNIISNKMEVSQSAWSSSSELWRKHTENYQSEIEALQNINKAMQDQLDAAKTTIGIQKQRITNLEQGMTGSDLQTPLAEVQSASASSSSSSFSASFQIATPIDQEVHTLPNATSSASDSLVIDIDKD